jgi:hypothetical protein
MGHKRTRGLTRGAAALPPKADREVQSSARQLRANSGLMHCNKIANEVLPAPWFGLLFGLLLIPAGLLVSGTGSRSY